MNGSNIKGVALNLNSYKQLTDHLVPLCDLMQMPLLLTEESYADEIKEWYPNINISLKPLEEVTTEYLVQKYDFFVLSEYWNRDHFYSRFSQWEKKYNKTVRCVHCPHGFSDKYRWFLHAVAEDILLVYGDNLLDMFKALGTSESLNAFVRTGNYRYEYYLKYKKFFDDLVEKEIWKKFSHPQPTLLYAPSWNAQEDNPSIYGASELLLDQLPSEYNLLYKVHPLHEELDAPHLYRLMGKFEKKGNIQFVKDFPVIYPLLARSEMYIGDMSAIGYDFLTFNRPMFFLNQNKIDSKTDRRAFLFRCGIEILPEDYPQIYSILADGLKKENQFKTIRKEVYDYTFGSPVKEEELKRGIIEAYFSPKKPFTTKEDK